MCLDLVYGTQTWDFRGQRSTYVREAVMDTSELSLCSDDYSLLLLCIGKGASTGSCQLAKGP